MSHSTPGAPIDLTPARYDRSLEQLDKDEAETNQGLIETITKIQQKVYQDAPMQVVVSTQRVTVVEPKAIADLAL